MRKTLVAASAALCLLATGAVAESRTYTLDGFDRIDIKTGLNAVVTLGETQSVRIEAHNGSIFDQIDLNVRGGELNAKRNKTLLDIILSGGILNMRHDDGATIYITVPALTAVSASTGSNVDVDLMTGDRVSIDASSGSNVDVDTIEAGSLSLDASSGSRISVGGTCDRVDLEMSSGAHISGDDLVCTNADVDGSSGASASFGANKAVTGSVSSGASIRLNTKPETVSVESSSGGSVRIR